MTKKPQTTKLHTALQTATISVSTMIWWRAIYASRHCFFRYQDQSKLKQMFLPSDIGACCKLSETFKGANFKVWTISIFPLFPHTKSAMQYLSPYPLSVFIECHLLRTRTPCLTKKSSSKGEKKFVKNSVFQQCKLCKYFMALKPRIKICFQC